MTARPWHDGARHPLVELQRSFVRRNAVKARMAALELEVALMRGIDNDGAVDAAAEAFGRATVNLSLAMQVYKTTRDIEGIG